MKTKSKINILLILCLLLAVSCGTKSNNNNSEAMLSLLNIENQVNSILNGVNSFQNNNSTYFYAYSSDDIYLTNNYHINQTTWDKINYSTQGITIGSISPFYNQFGLLILDDGTLYLCNSNNIAGNCKAYGSENPFPIEGLGNVTDIKGENGYQYVIADSHSIYVAYKDKAYVNISSNANNGSKVDLINTLKQLGLNIGSLAELKYINSATDLQGNLFILFHIGDDDKNYLIKYDVSKNDWENSIYSDHSDNSIAKSPNFVISKNHQLFFIPIVKNYFTCRNKNKLLFLVSRVDLETQKIQQTEVAIPDYDCSDIEQAKIKNISIDAQENFYIALNNGVNNSVHYTNVNTILSH